MGTTVIYALRRAEYNCVHAFIFFCIIIRERGAFRNFLAYHYGITCT